jgi:hypothetical protein
MSARLVVIRRTAVFALGLSAVACADASSSKSGGGADAAQLQCTDPAFCEGVCQLDRDCPIGERCVDARCRDVAPVPDMAVTAMCMRNGDCPDGFGCDAETRLCVPLTPTDRACDDVRDCFAGEICVDDYCRPEPDAAVVIPPPEPDAAVVVPPPDPDAAVVIPPPDPDAAVVIPPPDPDAAVVIPPPDPDAAVVIPPPDPDAAVVIPPDPDAAVVIPDMDAAVVIPPDPDAAVILPPDPDAAVVIPPDPDAAPPPPDAAPPLPDVPIGPPPTPGRGVYDFGRVPLGGAEELRAVEFHPDGDYAVVLQRTNVVHVIDWQTQTATRYDLRPGPNINIYWDDLAFDPSGGFAYAVGTRISANAREGVIYRFDDATYRHRDANMMPPLTEIRRVAGQEYSGIEYPWAGGNPVVLAKSGQSGPNAFLRDLDPQTNDFGDFIVAQPVGVGCEDLAFVNNEFGDPGILVVCGTNGEGAFYYTEIAGIGEVRVDPGNNNMGNTSVVGAYPGGDYALIVGWSGRHLWRFQDALINTFNDAPWFQRQDIWGVRFQQDGQRALIFGGSFGNPLRAYVIEYRHDLYRCVSPFDNCDFTDVSVPNFGAAPFSAVQGTRLNDAAFRPGCDGGLLVGGYTNFQGSSAQLVKFQVLGARDCGP